MYAVWKHYRYVLVLHVYSVLQRTRLLLTLLGVYIARDSWELCSIVSIPGIVIGHGIALFWQSRHNDSVNMACGCMTLTLQLDAHADSNAN